MTTGVRGASAALRLPAGETHRVQENDTPQVTEVLAYRPRMDGYLQLELRRYIRRDDLARERGPYWYFQFREGGKRKMLYLSNSGLQKVNPSAARASQHGQ